MFSKKFFGVVSLIILFLSFVSALSAQTNETDEVIKVDVALVNIPFSVSDRDGRMIAGLNLQNFQLFEDGKPQKIEYLSTQDNPLNIVLLLDSSISAQDIFEKIKNAAAEFIKELRPADSCMIISFDEAARVKSEFTNNQKTLDNAIKRISLSQKNGTLLRDTISVTVEKELTKVKGRKAIIVISDGKDVGSAITQNELLYNLNESDAPVYSVIYPNNSIPFSANSQNKNQISKVDPKKFKLFQSEQLKKTAEGVEYLSKVSEITGGRIFQKEINNLSEAFNTIAEELRKQYLISFYPDDSNYDVSKHQLRIKVDKKNAVIRMKNINLLKK